MSNRVELSTGYFPNPDKSRSLPYAQIYVGIIDLDPEILANQKQISVLQESGAETPVSQPLLTNAGGIPVYNGSPVTILVDGSYSLKVLDKHGSQVYYIPKNAESTDANITVETIADLRNITGDFENQSFTVLGYDTPGDGGGGPLRVWKTGGSYVDNGGSVITPGGVPGADAWIFANNINEYDFRWFGANGIATDDTVSVNATLDALALISGTLKQSPGVFGYAGSLDIPDRINIIGSGAPQIATFPQFGGDKSLLRPGFKHLVSGTSILFLSVDKTYTTNRSDRYASMTYAASFTPANSSYSMRDIALIQNMDVFDAGGTLTTTANDNRADIDAGLITNSTGASHDNVTIFGYFNDAGLVIHNDLASPSLDPDYNTFIDCSLTGGTAIIGSDTAGGPIGEGNTGQRFIGCGTYAADHHTRADGDYTIPAIFIDGFISSAAGGIRGHSWTGGNIRTYANDAIVTDHCDDIGFVNCATEFALLAGVANADALGGFSGTANTKAFRAVALAATSDMKMGTYVASITGPFQVVGAGPFDTAIFGQDGSGVRLFGSGNDSNIQLTSDFSSTVSDWLIQRDGDAGDLLEIKYDNAIISALDKDGGLRYGGSGSAAGNLTIDSGSITIGSSDNVLIFNEGGIPSDNLANVNGGRYDGHILILRAGLSSGTVVVNETGNIRLNVAGDFSMDNGQDRLMLQYDGLNWVELSRSDNSA